MKLTNESLLHYIATYQRDHDAPPSVREIAAHFGCSITTVNQRLNKLTRLGYLSRQARKARAMALTEAGKELAA